MNQIQKSAISPELLQRIEAAARRGDRIEIYSPDGNEIKVNIVRREKFK